MSPGVDTFTTRRVLKVNGSNEFALAEQMKTGSIMNFEIRTAALPDAQAISDIYNYYVATSTCTYDVDQEQVADRVNWLESHGPKHPVIVCTHDEAVVGWGSLSQWNPRPGYDRTAEVSFYVQHDWHRRGIGRLMLGDLIDRARTIGHRVLIGGASAEQTASIRLQESFGFEKVAHFKAIGYKFDQWLDVAYFQLVLGTEDRE